MLRGGGRFAAAFAATLLVNNAGVNNLGLKRTHTEDGFEYVYGVNYIGHFYLTSLLTPMLVRSAPSRIINVRWVRPVAVAWLLHV